MQHSSSRSGFEPTPTLFKLCTAWNRARRGRSLPARHHLDPRDLGSDLDNVSILERRSEFDFRIRTCGRMISDQIGMELRGMPGVTLFAPQYRQTVTDLFVNCVETRCGTELGVIGLATEEDGHLLLLPMFGPDGRVDRILCGLDAGAPICPPNRFSVASIAQIPLAMISGLAETAQETPTPFRPKLVKGGGMKSAKTPSRPDLKLVG